MLPPDCHRVVEPLIMQAPTAPCRLVERHTVTPNRAYCYEGYEPGGTVKHAQVPLGKQYNRDVYRLTVASVECQPQKSWPRNPG